MWSESEETLVGALWVVGDVPASHAVEVAGDRVDVVEVAGVVEDAVFVVVAVCGFVGLA